MGILYVCDNDNNDVMQILCYTESGDPWEEQEVAKRIFITVSRYSWEVKLVMVLAAFAVNYGDCLLTSQLNTVNPMLGRYQFLSSYPLAYRFFIIMSKTLVVVVRIPKNHRKQS